MTSPAVEPPEAAAEPVSSTRPSPTGVVREAWHLILRYPRSMLLPMLLVQVLVAIVVAATSAILYLTAFKDEPYPRGGLFGVEEFGAGAFVLALLIALNVLFAGVAQGATIVATARAVAGKPASLVEALDPAFIRMGALLAMTLTVVSGFLFAVVTVLPILALLYLAPRLSFVYNTLMLDQERPLGAFRRSWSMSRGHVLRIGAVMLLLALLLVPMVAVQALPFTPVDQSRGTRITIDSIRIVVEAVLRVPFLVLASAATTVFYLRIRENNGEPAPRI